MLYETQYSPAPLPEFMKTAQSAVQNNPAVQEMIRQLAEFGLAVCIPHMHTTTSDFEPLPAGMIQVERNQVVTFEPVVTSSSLARTAVSWRWQGDANGIGVVAECGCCSYDPATGHSYPGDG